MCANMNAKKRTFLAYPGLKRIQRVNRKGLVINDISLSPELFERFEHGERLPLTPQPVKVVITLREAQHDSEFAWQVDDSGKFINIEGRNGHIFSWEFKKLNAIYDNELLSGRYYVARMRKYVPKQTGKKIRIYYAAKSM
jgi:hypothetical protein